MTLFGRQNLEKRQLSPIDVWPGLLLRTGTADSRRLIDL